MFRKQKKKKKQSSSNITTIFILLLSIYTIAINNNSVLSNNLTNNRVLYIDNTGKLATTDTEPNTLSKINNIESNITTIQQQLEGKQGIITIDDELNSSSSNPIANKTVKSALDEKQNKLVIGSTLSLSILTDETELISQINLTDNSINKFTLSTLWNYLKGKITLLVYPVGSIYMLSFNSTSPTTLFGGTWEQIKDRFLLSAGSNYFLLVQQVEK